MAVVTDRPAPDRPEETALTGAPDVAPGCAACRFVEATVERRSFFLFAEGLGEPSTILRMANGGGFCPRHARHILARDDASRIAYTYELVVDREAHDLAADRPERTVVGCPLCETQQWAEGHAIWTLERAFVDPDGRFATSPIQGVIDPATLCLRHLDVWFAAAPRDRYSDVRGCLLARLEDLRRPDGAEACAIAAAGRDLDRPIRSGDPSVVRGRSRVHSDAWSDGALSADGLLAELAAGRCPACTAAVAAAGRLIRWVDVERRTAGELRELDRLCAAHLWDAVSMAPRATALALAGTIERHVALADALASVPPRRAERGRRLPWSAGARDRAAAAGQGARPAADRLAIIRDTWPRCVACAAMATALDRTVALLDALLEGRPARDRYERSPGLCLRHARIALPRLGAEAATTVRAVARARSVLAVWDLRESLRKTSWSYRHEPQGPERDAWRHALALVAGDGIFERTWLAPEPRGDVPAL